MCNAWNHSPDCTCGWGGEGYKGKASGEYGDISGFPPIRLDAYESYVNPNARCPVCGEQVFFYQSPDGGRVFFDELGPPWPKHPCTDVDSIPKALNSGEQIIVAEPAWSRDGWVPFLNCRVESIDPKTIRLQGSMNGVGVFCYVDKQGVQQHVSPGIGVLLAQIMCVAEGEYRVALLNGAYDSVEFTGFRGKSAANGRRARLKLGRDPYSLAKAAREKQFDLSMSQFLDSLVDIRGSMDVQRLSKWRDRMDRDISSIVDVSVSERAKKEVKRFDRFLDALKSNGIDQLSLEIFHAYKTRKNSQSEKMDLSMDLTFLAKCTQDKAMRDQAYHYLHSLGSVVRGS